MVSPAPRPCLLTSAEHGDIPVPSHPSGYCIPGRASSWKRDLVPHSCCRDRLCFACLGIRHTALSSFTQLFVGAGRGFLSVPKWKERNPESAAFSELDGSQSLGFSKNNILVSTANGSMPTCSWPRYCGDTMASPSTGTKGLDNAYVLHGYRAGAHSGSVTPGCDPAAWTEAVSLSCTCVPSYPNWNNGIIWVGKAR